MVAIEAASLFISSPRPSLFKPSSSCKPPISFTRLFCISKPNNRTLSSLSLNFPVSPSINPPKPCLQISSTAQETAIEVEPDQTQNQNPKRKLFVFNLPWTFSVGDIKNLFGQCGTVSDVEIIKQKDGKSRNFAFVTMSSGEEAQAAIDKFNSQDVSGRTIRVEFALKFRKSKPSPPSPSPASPSPPSSSSGETRHKLYVSNLAWKVRSSHLREFFSAEFNPLSANVVFESEGKRSAGYGFVSFATDEEAKAAITSLDGKELMGRPIRLKWSERSERNPDVSESEQQEVETSENPTAAS